MIYLIKTPVFLQGDEEKDDTSVLALKIGYTDDLRKRSRFDDYRNNGVSLRVLKTISGGSVQLEHCLQRHFSEHNIPGRSIEWFFYNLEVVEVFETLNTVDDIYRFLGFTDEKDFLNTSAPKRKRKSDKNYVPETFVEYYRKNNTIVDEGLLKDLELLDLQPGYAKKLDLLLNVLMISRSESYFNKLVSILPEQYVNYFNVLGVSGIKRVLNRNLKIEAELERESSNQALKSSVESRILGEFKLGTRVSLFEIKDKLRNIYEDLGYEKTPKAVDILDYFNCTSCNVLRTDGSGKRDKGFEILSVK